MPDEVKDANFAEHIAMLDVQLQGLLVSRAAACDVKAEAFDAALLHRSREGFIP
jgi:hypothetical protein